MTGLHNSPMIEIARELDRVFHAPNGGRYQPQAQAQVQHPVATPAVQVWETKETYTVALILPGLERESLDIEASSNLLKVSGKTAFRMPQDGELRYAEFKNVEFQRNIKLSQGIKTEAVTADYTDGVLTISLPKVDVPRSVKVQLQANGSHTDTNAVTV